MSRARTHLITNLYVKDHDIKDLANGKRVFKIANKHKHCIIPKRAVAKERLIEKQEEVVERELKRLAKMKGTDEVVVRINKPTGKRPYVKHNPEYWAKMKDPSTLKARFNKA